MRATRGPRLSGSSKKSLSSSGGRHLGLSLAGGKADRTAIAIIEHFPDQKRLAVLAVHSRVDSAPSRSQRQAESPDTQLIDRLVLLGRDAETITVDVPLTLPKCVECRLKCPGFEACSVPEVQWLRKQDEEEFGKRRNAKWSTPYTERAAEFYLAHSLEERFYPGQALGANMAPLTMRLRFLKRLFDAKQKRSSELSWYEGSTKVSLWRLGRALGVAKSHLRHHKHAIGSDESRSVFLEALTEKGGLFLYAQDRQTLIGEPPAFDALVLALTGHFAHQKQTEPRPNGYPVEAAWPQIPVIDTQFVG